MEEKVKKCEAKLLVSVMKETKVSEKEKKGMSRDVKSLASPDLEVKRDLQPMCKRE